MKNVKRLFFCSALLLLPAIAFAQEANEDLINQFNQAVNKWKRNTIWPSYGLMLFHGRVRPGGLAGVTSSLGEEGFFIPAVDARFFMGKNVTKRGTFYSGIESGVFAFVSGLMKGNASFTDTVSVYDSTVPYTWPGTYTFHVQLDGAFVFLMAKYGLRVDMGTSLLGMSLGLELGSGVGIYNGGIKIYVGDKKNSIAETDFGKEGSNSRLGLLVDTAVDASIRLGRNFRVFGKLGLIILPLQYPERDVLRVDNKVMTPDAIQNSNEEYMRYALQNYLVEIDAFAYDLRFGFALSFN